MRGEELYNNRLMDSCCAAATVESLRLGGGAPQRALVGDKHTAECCNDGAELATKKIRRPKRLQMTGEYRCHSSL